jgi:hypothetical protein
MFPEHMYSMLEINMTKLKRGEWVKKWHCNFGIDVHYNP